MTTPELIAEILGVIVIALIVLIGIAFIIYILITSVMEESMKNEYLKNLNDQERLTIEKYKAIKPNLKNIFKRRLKK